MSKTISQRFWPKVDTTGECWIWTGCKSDRGYGYFWDGKKMVRTHRWIYERVRGPIPSGMQIDHLCRQRLCVKLSHLEIVTGRENTLRGESVAAHYAKRDACIHGHPFTPDNTFFDKAQAARRCRTCKRDGYRRRNAKKRLMLAKT